MTPPFEAFVRARMAETAKSNPGLHASLQEVGGMLLLGTIGLEVAVKPDGSVWVREEQSGSSIPNPGRTASAPERLGFLNEASGKWPELRLLNPARPFRASSCVRGNGP